MQHRIHPWSRFGIAGIAALVALGGIHPAQASETEFLPWTQVHIVATERPDVGRVSFSAEVADGQWKSVDIEAFGQRHTLTPAQCAQLQGFPLESLKTTYEAGYPALGGRMVHFKFRATRYQESVLITSEVVIAVTRDQGLKVYPAREVGNAGH